WRHLRVQRQPQQRWSHRQPAAGRLRRGAGSGQSQGLRGDPRGQHSRTLRSADRIERADRDARRRGLPEGRCRARLSGHRPRSIDGGEAVAGGSAKHDKGDVPQEPEVAPPLQEDRAL
ncbi:uncharacterized protein METZ01_LOCUS305261, partial [marine metagenome]